MHSNRVIDMLEYIRTFDGINYGATDIALKEAVKAVKFRDRAEELLKACVELLNKQDESPYVLNLLDELVYYDECECDGNCLLEDIKSLLKFGE